MAPAVRFGYKVSAEQFGPRELLDFTIAAERSGFDTAAISDHFQPWRHTGGHAPFSLSWLGAKQLDSVLPWPLVCLLTVAIVFLCGATLTAVLARTPLAVPLTGRKQQPWSTLIPRPRRADRTGAEPAALEPALDLEPALRSDADLEPAAMAAGSRDKNGL